MLILLLALLLVASSVVGESSLEKMLTPNLKDAKETTDAEILSAVQSKNGKQKSMNLNLAKEEAELEDPDEVELPSGGSKRMDVNELGDDEEDLDHLFSKPHVKKSSKKTTTTVRVRSVSSSSTSALSSANDYLNEEEKALLEHYEVNWRDIEARHLPHLQVAKLLAIYQANDYLSIDEKKLLKHFGFNFRVLEDHHVSRAAIDEKLRTLIMEEHKKIFGAVDATTSPSAPTTAPPSTEAPTTEPPPPLAPDMKELLSVFGYDWAAVEKARLAPEDLKERLGQQAKKMQETVMEKLKAELAKVDKEAQTDYDERMSKALAALEKMQNVDRTIVEEARKVKAQGSSYIKNVELKAKEEMNELVLDMKDKAEKIDEEAKEKKKEVVDKDQATWKEFKAEADKDVQNTHAKMVASVDKAKKIDAAAKLWYEKEEFPAVEKIVAEAREEDAKLRHEAVVKAEYKLMQLRKVLPKEDQAPPVEVPAVGIKTVAVPPSLVLPEPPSDPVPEPSPALTNAPAAAAASEPHPQAASENSHLDAEKRAFLERFKRMTPAQRQAWIVQERAFLAKKKAELLAHVAA